MIIRNMLLCTALCIVGSIPSLFPAATSYSWNAHEEITEETLADYPIINVTDLEQDEVHSLFLSLTQDEERLVDGDIEERVCYCDGVKYADPFILEFPMGYQLPLWIFIEGDLLSLNTENALFITINDTFYLKYEDDSITLSSDLMIWKNFLDFTTGDIGFSIVPDEYGFQVFITGNLNKA